MSNRENPGILSVLIIFGAVVALSLGAKILAGDFGMTPIHALGWAISNGFGAAICGAGCLIVYRNITDA